VAGTFGVTAGVPAPAGWALQVVAPVPPSFVQAGLGLAAGPQMDRPGVWQWTSLTIAWRMELDFGNPI